MQLAVQCKLCPVCNGAGIRDIANQLPKKRQEFPCENCQGQRYVPLVTCRGCGRAAIQWDAVVPYCGREACWEKLVEMIDPNKPVHPFHAAGLAISDRRRSFHPGHQYVWDPIKKDYVDSIDLQNRGLSQEQEDAIEQAFQFGWCC